MNKFLSTAYVLLAGALWGTTGIFVRNLWTISTNEIVFLRLTTTAILIALYMLIFDRKVFKIKLKDIWCFCGTGFVGTAGLSFSYYATISMSSLSLACILMYTSPIFIAIMSLIFFKEKITLKKVCCLLVVFIGTICSSYSKDMNVGGVKVILIGLLSGLCYGSYTIFSRFALNKGYSLKSVLLYTFVFSSLFSMIFVPYKDLVYNIQNDNVNFLFVLGNSVIATILPYLFYTLGLKGLDNGKASIFSSLEIVSASVCGIIVFDELPSVLGYIGIALLLLGITIMNLELKNKSFKSGEFDNKQEKMSNFR